MEFIEELCFLKLKKKKKRLSRCNIRAPFYSFPFALRVITCKIITPDSIKSENKKVFLVTLQMYRLDNTLCNCRITKLYDAATLEYTATFLSHWIPFHSWRYNRVIGQEYDIEAPPPTQQKLTITFYLIRESLSVWSVWKCLVRSRGASRYCRKIGCAV